MKKIILPIIFVLTFACGKSQDIEYTGPVEAITNGYGAFGDEKVSVINFDNPLNDAKKEQDVSIFYPTDSESPVPTLFFSHGYMAVDSAFFSPLLRFVASKGFAVVYVPQTFYGVCKNYPIILKGFQQAAREYSNIIDTTRVGIMGHSFGAGAIPWLGKKLMIDWGWGEQGRFLFITAPWYAHLITQTDLENFPSDCALLMQVYEEDAVNDHRIAIDIFNNINIPKEEKDFIFVKTDEIEGYTYKAAHNLSVQFAAGGVGKNVQYNAHDYYAVFRLLDAMMDYKFNGNQEAKKIALGNGSKEQVDMGGILSDLISTDDPKPMQDQSYYRQPCNNTDELPCPKDTNKNPRTKYCSE